MWPREWISLGLILESLVVEVLDGAGLGVSQAGAGETSVGTYKTFLHF